MDASVVGGAVEEGFPDDTTSVVVFDLTHIKNTMHEEMKGTHGQNVNV